MEISKLTPKKTPPKKQKNNGSITAGFWKFTKMCLSFSYRERKKVKVKFGRTASQWKKNNKAEDLQAYWYILTEMVQVTYFED